MKVLIADDTKTSRILTARILEKRGHEVKTVENGQAAIEQLAQEDFDLVLMDIQMPCMGGIEAARIIRSSNSPVRHHDVPILAISAGNESDRSNGKISCLSAGMNGYVSKPVRMQEFVSLVEQYRSSTQR
jgi:CheY-like chemotaxis protein